ncbi:CBS domain-containing protein [Nonomuraea sp. NPDC049684]|uniref:CBS domain-containing protein n=1 Tax=Nonomuraea sp. NPDC049684 TaxID=3364356 RepID=UPI003789EFEB
MINDGSIVLRVGDLPTARIAKLVSLSPADTLARAETLLTLHKFDRLPVLVDASTLLGVATLRSISIVRMSARSADLLAAVQQAHVVSIEAELENVMPILTYHGFAYVQDEQSHVSGIVTLKGALSLLERFSGTHLPLGEIERRLRGIVNQAFHTIAELRDVTGRSRIHSVEDLDLGGIEHVLRRADCWHRLGWQVDQDAFIEEVSAVRQIRNGFAHHRGAVLSPPNDGEVDRLVTFLSWLRALTAQ